MTRTGKKSAPWKAGEGRSETEKRRTNISRTCTRLLRHQAENEHVPITKEGWVIVSDLLAWKGLARFQPQVTLDELFDVVQYDRQYSKGRFGVTFIGDDVAQEEKAGTMEADGAATGEMIEMAAELSLNDVTPLVQQTSKTSQTPDQESESVHGTEEALTHHSSNPSTPASLYLIRAVQGHSIKAVGSEGLMTPITLDDPSSIPDTVVHSTFHAAWPSILSSGGLKPMTRNMVHFAAGPAFSDIVPSDLDPVTTTTQRPLSLKSPKDIQEILSRNNVISGMRWDAQILIYIDIKRLLKDIKEKGWEMKWWRSENGVILTEGLETPSAIPDTNEQAQAHTQTEENQDPDKTEKTSNVQTRTPDGIKPRMRLQQEIPSELPAEEYAEIRRANKETKDFAKMQPKPKSSTNVRTNRKQGQLMGRSQKIVPVEYFSAAVDIKGGMGVIWRAGEGSVNQLPDHLLRKGLPRGKGGQQASGGGAKKDAKKEMKPRVNVERDADHILEDGP